MPSAVEFADLLRDFVDVLLPGGAAWPAASVVGVQGVLAMRLLEVRGEDGAADLEAALLASGGPLAPLDAAARHAVVATLEREHGALFALARNAAYLAYYENPAVVRAVAGLGQPYRAMPGRDGYPIPPFDPAHDRPTHGRGAYVPTDQVRRLDLRELEGGHDGRA